MTTGNMTYMESLRLKAVRMEQEALDAWRAYNDAIVAHIKHQNAKRHDEQR